MGFDVGRFSGHVDEELICPICSDVLEDPIQAPSCEHVFCKGCITEWLSCQSICPVDRQTVQATQLIPVPRILRNILSKLVISCENSSYGCDKMVQLSVLVSHLEECKHNPKKPVPCTQGCGMVIPMDELKAHNCVRELRSLIHTQQQKLNGFEQALTDQRRLLSEQQMELNVLKEAMKIICSSHPAMNTVVRQFDTVELVRWSISLPRARVTRWGSIISTPNVVQQGHIKHSLLESGCPRNIVEELVKNCCEQQWPVGLSTLQTRQNNRRVFDNYKCRRIPGKQAVVVLCCDNAHMSPDLKLEPGFVMVFANGVD